MTNPPDYYCPYFLVFLLYVKQVFAHFWKAGCVTKSTSSDLSQLVGNPSARGPSLLKTISQDGVAYPTDTGRTRWAGRSRQSEQRGPEPGIKLGRLIHTGRITAGPEQSAHCLQQTPLSSALCRPHTHSTSLSFTILSPWSFSCERSTLKLLSN